MSTQHLKIKKHAVLLLAVTITSAALLSLTACGAKTTAPSTSAPSTTVSTTPSSSASTPDTAPTPSETQTVSPAASSSPVAATDKVYFGSWTISKVIAYGPVGTYSKDEAEKLVGKQLRFDADQATLINDQPSDTATVIDKPVYTESTVTANDSLSNFKMSFDKLGITASSVTAVDVSGADTAGCQLLIKDKNTMILATGGTYFELTRAK